MPDKIVCFTDFSKRFVRDKERKKYSETISAAGRNLREGKITPERYEAIVTGVHAKADEFANAQTPGGPARWGFNPVSRMRRSQYLTVREFGATLLSDSARTLHSAVRIGKPAVEAAADTLRGRFTPQVALIRNRLAEKYLPGSSAFGRFARAIRGWTEDSVLWAEQRLLQPFGGREPRLARWESDSIKSLRELSEEMYQHKKSSNPAVNEAAGKLTRLLGDFNEELRRLGLPEEEISTELPLFTNRRMLGVGPGGKARFVSNMTGEEFPVRAEEGAEGVQEVFALDKEAATHLYEELAGRSDFGGFEQQIPDHLTLRTGGKEKVVIETRQNEALYGFLLPDPQYAMGRYVHLKSGRAAARSRNLVDEDSDSYELSAAYKARLDNERLNEYKQVYGKEKGFTIGEDRIPRLGDKPLSDPKIDVKIAKAESTMQNMLSLIVGKPPSAEHLLARVSRPLSPFLKFTQQLNLVTRMAAISITSLPDLSNLTYVVRNGAIADTVKAMANRPPDEVKQSLRFLGVAQEGIAGTALARLEGLSSGYAQTRADPFTNLLNASTNQFGHISLINYYNDALMRGSYVASMDGWLNDLIGGKSSHFIDLLGQYGLNNPKTLAQAKQLAMKFGQSGGEGKAMDSGITRWTEAATTPEEVAQIRQVQDDVSAAFHRLTVDVLSMPTMGLFPEFLNNPAGRSILQFRSIVLSSYTRLIGRMLEAGRVEGRDGTALIVNFAVGVAVAQLKYGLKGRELPDDDLGYIMSVVDQTTHTAPLMFAFQMAQVIPGVDFPWVYGPTPQTTASAFLGPNAARIHELNLIHLWMMGQSSEDDVRWRRAMRNLVPFQGHPFYNAVERIWLDDIFDRR